MTRIGFQLYSLHGIEDPLTAKIGRVGNTVFEGVEFAGLGEASTDEIVESLDRTALATAGLHIDIDDIEADPIGVAATANALGTEDVIVPWLPPEHFETREAIEVTADRLDELAATLATHGLTLHYHNHNQEFRTVGDDPAFELLSADTDTVCFEVDLGWAGAAGYDPLLLLDDIADRVSFVHLKDYDADAGEPVPVDTGDLDVAGAIDRVRSHDVDWLIYEAETAPNTYDTLDAANDVIEAHW